MVSDKVTSRLKKIQKLVLQVIHTTTTYYEKLVLSYIILLVIERSRFFRDITSNTGFRGQVHG